MPLWLQKLSIQMWLILTVINCSHAFSDIFNFTYSTSHKDNHSLCWLVQTISIFKTRSFTRGSFHGFVTCHIPVYGLMSVSHLHIHHSHQSMIFDWSGGNRWCGMHCRYERVEAGFFFFTVLISGWPVVFVSPKREVVSWGRKWLLSQCIAAVSYEVIVRMPCVHACTRRARGRGVHLS